MTTTHTFYLGHVLDVLKALPGESVHCVVTSGPYWGLRAYGTRPQVWGGDPACEHDWRADNHRHQKHGDDGNAGNLEGGRASQQATRFERPASATCSKCQAWLGELGLERTPDLYVSHLVEVFREVRRVLRNDGTLWLNLGDSYASHPPRGKSEHTSTHGKEQYEAFKAAQLKPGPGQYGYKSKDLIGIPWRVALALQGDGWYLRSDIVWSKPNPMPESVSDRPTSSHEYVFLLSKSERYFYDAVAIQEPQVCPQDSTPEDVARALNRRRLTQIDPRQDMIRPPASATFKREGSKRETPIPGQRHGTHRPDREDTWPTGYRNKRDVWTLASQPWPKAHFATFPEALVEPCILAGSSEMGCCPKCGAPWARATSKHKVGPIWNQQGPRTGQHPEKSLEEGRGKFAVRYEVATDTLGWHPTCSCGLPPVPCTVADFFGGSGTVSVVAQRYGRSSIYADLKADYRQMAVDRMRPEQPSLVQPYEIVLKEVVA